MDVFQIIALLITLAALFSYLNHRVIRLPTTIGLMLISLVFSMALIASGSFGLGLKARAAELMVQIDFNQTLMHGMLSFLLFAGALHVDLSSLLQRRWTIGILATLGVVTSTFLIAGAMFFVLGWIGFPLSFLYCLIFGALISPTDPIAVMGLLKQARAPKSLETKISGESLFNDGVGVVVFLVIREILESGQGFDVSRAVILLLEEGVGGIALGLLLGWITFRMLRSIDNYQVEILLTLALVTGGYALANAIHTSGPLAIVAAGLLIGNRGRALAMSDRTREHLDTFWELIDEVLNAVLFVLIGMEILVLNLNPGYLLAGLIAIPVVLAARFISVGVPVSLLRLRSAFSPHVINILTWGGLRGGISVALALSLPTGTERTFILTVTYVVVVFSIVVQGLTMPALLRKAVPGRVAVDAPEEP